MSASPPSHQASNSNLSHLAGKHIIISGAGIAGLSFAIALHKQWPTVAPIPQLPKITIYERDSRDDRLGREGYSLSLRSDGDRGGGVQVLDDLGLYEAVRDVAVIVDGEGDDPNRHGGSMVLWDKAWNPLIRIDSARLANKGRRKLGGMRIRRNALQEVLARAVEQLPRVSIEWERSVIGVEQRDHSNADIDTDADGASPSAMTVLLADNQKLPCDLLIAADGSKSRLRSALRPTDGLDFRGIVILAGTAKFKSQQEIPGSLAKDWGACLGWNGVGLFVSPVDTTSALWSLSYRSPTPRDVPKKPYTQEVADELLLEARRLGAYAGEKLRVLIDNADPSSLMCFNTYDRPPFSHDLRRDGNIIWVGDANHAVSPFAGNGANMALMDTWDLAGGLIRCGGFEESVKQFEGSMLERTRKVLKQSHFNIDVGHAVGPKAWLYWVMLKGLGYLMRLGWFM